MGLKPRAIEVHIGELVLEGYSPAEAQRIGAAVEQELGRLLAEHGLPGGLAGYEREALAPGAFSHEPRATPLAVGGAVARSVYAGLRR